MKEKFVYNNLKLITIFPMQHENLRLLILQCRKEKKLLKNVKKNMNKWDFFAMSAKNIMRSFCTFMKNVRNCAEFKAYLDDASKRITIATSSESIQLNILFRSAIGYYCDSIFATRIDNTILSTMIFILSIFPLSRKKFKMFSNTAWANRMNFISMIAVMLQMSFLHGIQFVFLRSMRERIFLLR